MKTPKPGQFVNINGVIVRAVKQTNGCKGCMFDNLFSCPKMIDSRNSNSSIECIESRVIFKKI
nr:MAG TPA: hypothetical protein [Caudoviricetes sp.]